MRLKSGVAVCVLALAILPRAAGAAEAVPGNSCTGIPGIITNSFQWAGAPENHGVLNGMFCNGSTWRGIINFKSSGNVGIGTTSPATRVDVNGTIRFGYGGEACDSTRLGALYFSSATHLIYGCLTAGGWTPISTGSTAGAAAGSDRQVQFNSHGALAGNGGLVYTSAGYLGLGTTTPSAQLSVGSGGTADFNDGGGSIVISNNETPCYPRSNSIILGGTTAGNTSGVGLPGDCDTDVGVVIGSGAQTTGGNNDYWQVVIGFDAVVATEGPKNVLVGDMTYSGATDNTVIGFNAAAIYPPIPAHGNSVAVGSSAFAGGIYSVAVGSGAATGNPYSVAVGAYALASEQTGSRGFLNTAIGTGALANATTGDGNVGVGDSALDYVGAGTDNTVIGSGSLWGNNGNGNVAVGDNTGSSLTGGSEDILIGDSVDAPSPTSSYFMNIGDLIYATGLYPGSSGGPSNVGIGTATPDSALDVNGVINAAGNDTNGFSGFTWDYGATPNAPLISVGWPGSTAFTNYIKSSAPDNMSLQIGAATDPSATGNLYFSTGTNPFAMSILRNGQVGISVFPPDDDLSIGDANGDGDTEIHLTTTGTSDVTIGTDAAGDSWFWNNGAGSDLMLATGNSLALLIDGQQRVGIGGVSPALALDVAGKGGAPATTGTVQTGFARFENAVTYGNVLDVGGFTASPYGLWLQAADRGGLSTDYPIVLNPNGGNVGIGSMGAGGPGAALDVGGSFALSYDITPTSLGSSQNNYNPTSLASAAVLRLSASTAVNITGLQGGTDGRVIGIMNVSGGANTITLKNNSGSSSAGNKFCLTGDLAVAQNDAVLLIYDNISTCWRHLH